MFITILDLILLIITFLFVSFGFFAGFISVVGSLIGLVIGTWVAGRYYEGIGSWLSRFFLDQTSLANIVAFIFIFTVVNRLVGLIFWTINKVFKIFSIIPFTKTINRILGAVLGLVEAILFLGVILYFISKFNFSDWMTMQLATSQVATWLIFASNILTPLLPDVVRQLSPL